MLIHGQGAASDGDATVLNKNNLHKACNKDDEEEHEVIEETSEYIIFLNSKLSGIDFIEYLHKHKGVEHQCVVACFLRWNQETCGWIIVNSEEFFILSVR
jgi:hypothetical protein